MGNDEIEEHPQGIARAKPAVCSCYDECIAFATPTTSKPAVCSMRPNRKAKTTPCGIALRTELSKATAKPLPKPVGPRLQRLTPQHLEGILVWESRAFSATKRKVRGNHRKDHHAIIPSPPQYHNNVEEPKSGFLDVFSGTGTISFTEKTQPEYLFRTLLPQCVSIMARLP